MASSSSSDLLPAPLSLSPLAADGCPHSMRQSFRPALYSDSSPLQMHVATAVIRVLLEMTRLCPVVEVGGVDSEEEGKDDCPLWYPSNGGLKNPTEPLVEPLI